MKKFSVLGLLSLCLAFTAQAQQLIITDDPDNPAEKIYNGKFTYMDVEQDQYLTSWMRRPGRRHKEKSTDRTSDEINTEIQTLKDRLHENRVIIFLGTWCEDSQEMLPELISILKNDLQYPLDRIEFYGVDKDKRVHTNEQDTYNIELVPTVIFQSSEGNEVFRIVETVNGPLINELLKLNE